MNKAATASPSTTSARTGVLLVAGILLATLTEALAGTALALGRGDIIGDTHATPDEFAWLDIGYTALKLIGFITAPWLMSRFPARAVIIGATLVMGLACAVAALTARLDLLVALRMSQGFAGGALLVERPGDHLPHLLRATISPSFKRCSRWARWSRPAALAPAVQGWLVDSQSWTWIFFGVVPLALAASGLLLSARRPDAGQEPATAV